MINLRTRTEYSFSFAYGKIDDVIDKAEEVACITDRGNTFGHILFYKKCKSLGKKCILGTEIAFVENAKNKVKATPFYFTLLAKNQEGLQEIYSLVSKSINNKFFINRLSYSDLSEISENIIIIGERTELQKYNMLMYFGVSPMTNKYDLESNRCKLVAISDNHFDSPVQDVHYQNLLGATHIKKYDSDSSNRHLLNKTEWKREVYCLDEEEKEEALNNVNDIANSVQDYNFPTAKLPDIESKSLRELCFEGAERRGIDLNSVAYKERLDLELKVISSKNFDKYFLIVRDLIFYAKRIMLVGAGRGSSAGSLVCYLLYITEVDPLVHKLLFSRFLSPERQELPDIDIDFEDTKRVLAIQYLIDKYGRSNVAKLGTVLKMKAKSSISNIAKINELPEAEIKELKELAEVDGLTGAFNSELGKELIEKYPMLKSAYDLEKHCSTSGTHASGVLVSNEPIEKYCAIDSTSGVAQLDKEDSEIVNLLKIDCLGLKNLTILQKTLDIVGKDRDFLLNYPLDDKEVFSVLNDKRYSGIFQFEGKALSNLTSKIKIRSFEDICHVITLGRKATLMNGTADEYVKLRNGEIEINYLPKCEKYTKETYGLIIYQEQVMTILKELGNLSWEDVSIIRKAITKTYDEEKFISFFNKFATGCKNKHNLSEEEIKMIWDKISSMASYTFNKSHAVCYSIIAYHCMLLKYKYPLVYAMVYLNTIKSEDEYKEKMMLREIDRENIKYEIFNEEKSMADWNIIDNTLFGGFSNIKGIGIVKAKKLVRKRKIGEEYSMSESVLINNAITPFDDLFIFRDKYKNVYKYYNKFFSSSPRLIEEIEDLSGVVRVFARIVEVIDRSENEVKLLKKRGVKIENHKFADIVLADDTGQMKFRIPNSLYNSKKFDHRLLNAGNLVLCGGETSFGFKFVQVKKIRIIEEEEFINISC